MRYILSIIIICICLLTGCKQTESISNSDVITPIIDSVTKIPNTDKQNDNSFIKVGDLITEFKYSENPFKENNNLTNEISEEMTSLLSKISIKVQNIDDTNLYLKLETQYANAEYSIPYSEQKSLSDYYIYYDSQIDSYQMIGYLASRISIRDKNDDNEIFELGYVFIDKPFDRSKQYDMACFFIPNDKYREDESNIYEYSLLGYGANEENNLKADQEMYAKLCFPRSDSDCIIWEYYFGMDGEGNPVYMYADANKDYLEYDIDENCDIYYLESDGYKKISLTELRSYNLSYWSSNIYLIGIADGKIVYMINMFVS